MSSNRPKGYKRYLPFAIIAVVLGVVVIGAALLLRPSDEGRRARLGEPLSTGNPPPVVPRAPHPGAQPPHTRGGGPDAAATLEEFGDFQCPPCGRLHTELKKIEADYGTRLRVVFRHLPLVAMHKHALAASHAAEAAARQGRFWEMHDLLYENQEAWNAASDVGPLFTNYARRLGLDVERFTRDMNSPEVSARVRADVLRADSLGVNGTPTLFLNNQQLSGQSTVASIRAAIDAALAQKSR